MQYKISYISLLNTRPSGSNTDYRHFAKLWTLAATNETSLNNTTFIACWISSLFAERCNSWKTFQLTGKIIAKVELTPDCGIFAFGTVIKFEVKDLVGLTYPYKSIGVIVTCPELYEEYFLETGNNYQVILSDKNQTDFEWLIPNRDLLKTNRLSFDPYVVSIKKKL